MWRLAIFIAIFCVFELYVFQAVRVAVKNKWLRRLYVCVSLFVLGYLLFVFINYNKSAGTVKDTLIAIGLFLLLFVPKLLIFVILVVEDIVRLTMVLFRFAGSFFLSEKKKACPLQRRKFISKLALGLATIPFSILIYGMFKGKYNFKVLKHRLYFDDLPEAFDGFRVVQISDIHSGSLDNREKITYAVDLINEQAADLLLFTGDIVNTKAAEMNPWITTFRRLKAPYYGMYSVLGNHDYGEYVSWDSPKEKEANFKAIKAIHPRIGFRLLLNESVFIEKDGARIALTGVENWGINFKKAGDLGKASKGTKKKDFKILMSHDPSHWEHEVKNFPHNYQLTLSGHTHGFQFGIEIPGVFKWSPAQYIYKQWAGIYKENGRYINVNRGFGFLAYPGRIGIWPEITVLELKKKPKVV